MATADNSQTASAVLMVRPAAFGSNPQTLASNAFQQPATGSATATIERARQEIDTLIAALTDHGVRVISFEGRTAQDAPDECFPNNWISTHTDGSVVLYPMMANNRRRERRSSFLTSLQQDCGYEVARRIDLSHHERQGRYLEGTGSVVLDRVNRIAYACLSPRTHPQVLNDFADRLGYEAVHFTAATHDGTAVYHTNVMLSVGQNYCVVCSAAITDIGSRSTVLDRLGSSGREIIDVSLAQVRAFAANLLQLRGTESPLIALSAGALRSLTVRQREQLAAHGRLVSVDLPTIETCGGGSLRCLLAEIFLPECATNQ